MRQLKAIAAMLLVLTLGISAQTYRTLSVREVQLVPQDSLLRMDTLQFVNKARDWKLQTAPIFNKAVRETVEVVGQVLVPAKVISFTGSGWTLLLRDTSADPTWGGMLVRNGTPADTTLLQNNGFLNLERGDVVKIRGYIDEFPASNPSSYSQLVPITSAPITVIETGRPIPAPPSVTVAEFYTGLFPGGSVRFSTGEKYEGVVVQLTNLTVVSVLNATNGTFNMVDSLGNMISTMDASKWFTTRVPGTGGYLYRDPTSTYALPPVNTIVDTIRGYISTNSGSEDVRGYRITPLFRGDIVYKTVLPFISTHRRDSVFVNTGVSPKTTVVAYPQTGGAPVRSVVRYYRVNSGSWQADTVLWAAASVDSTFRFTVPAQSIGSRVDYWFKVVDDSNRTITYANSAFGGGASDTTRGFFFYTVLGGSITVHDLQYTPFANGRSAYIGGSATIEGIVSADTSDILLASPSGGFYLQTSNAPWSGLWVTGHDSIMTKAKRGDMIRISGSVQESNEVTRLSATSGITVLSTGNAVPAPVSIVTSDIGTKPNGAASIEQYEGMLVRALAVAVSDTAPTFVDTKEYAVDDGSGQMLVRADGNNKYSNVSGDVVLGKTILSMGTQISSLTGIVGYSFNRYKLIPRANADFGTVTSVAIESDETPTGFGLAQNYPNPFNPATVIAFSLQQASSVRLTVHNLLGQEVAVLVNQDLTAGTHRVSFDASRLPSGVYFYRLTSGASMLTKRMVLVK